MYNKKYNIFLNILLYKNKIFFEKTIFKFKLFQITKKNKIL